jgi:hypothetical protein
MRQPGRRTAALVLVLMAAGCSSAEPGGSPADDDGGFTEGAADGGAVADGGAGQDGHAGDASDDGTPSGEAGADGEPADASVDGDGGPQCAPYGAPGDCITTTACAALGDHTSYPGLCPGAADIQCCIVTPSTSNNPPVPAGWVLMQQSQVTSAMTTWAVQILDDPAGYPMFSTTTQVFGTLDVLARVEWHPPDFNNSAIHRGVTLYEPSGSATD